MSKKTNAMALVQVGRLLMLWLSSTLMDMMPNTKISTDSSTKATRRNHLLGKNEF